MKNFIYGKRRGGVDRALMPEAVDELPAVEFLERVIILDRNCSQRGGGKSNAVARFGEEVPRELCRTPHGRSISPEKTSQPAKHESPFVPRILLSPGSNVTLRDASERTPLSSQHPTTLEAAVPVVEAVGMTVLGLLLANPRTDVAQRGAAGGASTDEC
ncbi:MAG: hypothetical protein IV100_19525 [Myxococcales bacterium]|nr:hypothetical protein [Myxococcales bacterium]